MAQTITTKRRNIKYLNRDFSGLKKDLIEFLKVYYPDTYQDFNESSIGVLLLELMAYVGDNFAFYLDKKFEENFIDSASEAKNVLRHAKQLGFKPFGKTASLGYVDGFLKVPAVNQNGKIIPNLGYAGNIKSAKLKGTNGQSYETVSNIDFSTVNIADPKFVQPTDRDAVTNLPKSFILRKPNSLIKSR